MRTKPIAAALLALATGWAAGGAAAQDTAATTAATAATGTGIEVDPQAYDGLWYEIARTPVPFQRQCRGGATASYEVVDAREVAVVNRCDLPDGGVDRIEGTARPLNEGFNAFEVTFPGGPPPQGANYHVEAVGPIEAGAYRWAAVRGSDDETAWILARTPELDEDALAAARGALEEAGVDPSLLQPTDQPPDAYEPQ